MLDETWETSKLVLQVTCFFASDPHAHYFLNVKLSLDDLLVLDLVEGHLLNRKYNKFRFTLYLRPDTKYSISLFEGVGLVTDFKPEFKVRAMFPIRYVAIVRCPPMCTGVWCT